MGKRQKTTGENPFEKVDEEFMSSQRIAPGTHQRFLRRTKSGRPVSGKQMRAVEELISKIGHVSVPSHPEPTAPNVAESGEPRKAPSLKDKGKRPTKALEGPQIQFGEQAKVPRWLVGPAPQELQRKQRNDIKLLPPTGSHSATNSPSPPRMATLIWKFDAGPSSQWEGLTEDELSRHAYKSLTKAIRDPVFRDKFRLEISEGSYGDIVADVEDCLPPLPIPPRTEPGKRGKHGVFGLSCFFFLVEKVC